MLSANFVMFTLCKLL